MTNLAANPDIPQLSIGVDGMTCASCVSHVERAIATVPSATAVSVNLALEKADIIGSASAAAIADIPFAAFGLLNPVFAGAAMAASSVCVVSNALLLRNWRPEREKSQ